MITYGFSKKLNLSFEKAIEIITQELKNELRQIAEKVEAQLKKAFDSVY